MTSKLGCHLGRRPFNGTEAEGERRAGWREHRIPTVAEHSPDPTWPEREMVRQLRARLYGPHDDEREDRHGG